MIRNNILSFRSQIVDQGPLAASPTHVRWHISADFWGSLSARIIIQQGTLVPRMWLEP
jgi:hypothetical protein